tara:strand:- start:204 stop:3830 length:3627 start_codon:yes stop_codon:yes gene_type:complete
MEKKNQRNNNKWSFWIDRGGTFTDIIGYDPFNYLSSFKILSGSDFASISSIFAIIRQETGARPDESLSSKIIKEIRIGTTIGTNALLERKGATTGFLVTKNFEDILRIGHQERPNLFDLRIRDKPVLYHSCCGIEERTDSKGIIIKSLDIETLKISLDKFRKLGCNSLSIAFLNSYKNPENENLAKEIASHFSFEHISVSHEVCNLMGFVDRCSTSVMDAYLTPIVSKYVKNLKKFTGDIPIKIMQSNGGLVQADKFRGKDSILSGPAGGVVGATESARLLERRNVVCFDMGGTSTDVAHFSGELEYRSKTEIERFTVVAPAVDVHTVAAGGGSVVSFDGTRFTVGPQSAGSDPGPACYGRGGPLTITDCNLILGFLTPKFFPKYFGKEKNKEINREMSFRAFQEQITGLKEIDITDIYSVAESFVRIANEKMANAIKKISVDKGYDLRNYTLQCYGGAGGQHCCEIADLLRVKEIIVSPNASVLSAVGVGLGSMKKIVEESIEKRLSPNILERIVKRFNILQEKIVRDLKLGDRDKNKLQINKLMKLKFVGTSEALPVKFSTWQNMQNEFERKFKNQFGFLEKNKDILISAIFIEVSCATTEITSIKENEKTEEKNLNSNLTQKIFEKGSWKQISFLKISDISDSVAVSGPLLINCGNTTVFVKTGWKCVRESSGDLLLRKSKNLNMDFNYQDEAINSILETSLFGNQLMSIGEQMGLILKKTAVSINIKERNDFSCAIFDGKGNLLANAPHIPVHLGSMSETVKSLVRDKTIRPGQVYLTNNPFNGGTHLPDLTCVSPVTVGKKEEILFYVASRGHHSDIGGKTPGSMPADSIDIHEEGILVDNLLVVDEEQFLETEIRSLFSHSTYPPRNQDQNIYDIKAQIAANQKGIEELVTIINEYGEKKITFYSDRLLKQGKQLVLDATKRFKNHTFSVRLDNGIKISVTIKIQSTEEKITIDFNGTDPQHRSNYNTPLAVTKASVLYVLRCLILEKNVPLNEGCLFPVEIKIPSDNLLNPCYPAAVVAGNVETSQKIVDCLLGALEMQAGSQGTMNNISFGNEHVQYYETICGGSGAGSNFNGADAIQSHMTNSRITDPEILEYNFPVRLENFSIRKNSGGKGKYCGGNGVIRKFTFLKPMILSILANNRKVVPHGLLGGVSGACGKNTLIDVNGTEVDLGSCCKLAVKAGESVQIETPGGGGFGRKNKE